jgi:phage terminase large subunit-like protein
MTSVMDRVRELDTPRLVAVRDDLRRYAWRSTARLEQIAPQGSWLVWYVRGGRGGGKTWTGANNFAEMLVGSEPGEWAVVAPTYGDARDTCIESTESGLIKALGGKAGPNGMLIDKGPHIASWNRSMGDLRLTNGSVVYADGADDGALRIQGKNLRGAWCDEVGLWRKWETAWDESLRYAVRKAPARIIATGTPKRNMPARKLVARLLADPKIERSLLRTVDNAAHLHPEVLEDLLSLVGTTLGRQELEGELLDDIDGALWTASLIDAHRVDEAPVLERVVVSVDPAGRASAQSDETGIVVAGCQDGHGYVLDDLSGRFTPDGWGRRTCLAYVEHQADAVVFERNNGHDMGPHIIRSSWLELAREGVVDGPVPRIVEVWATRGKQVRAEPLVAQYEQGRWHHVGGLPVLEDQLCNWVPGEGSPDRMDALVWAAWNLTMKGSSRGGLMVRRVPPDGLLTAAAQAEHREPGPVRRNGMRVRV